MCFSSYKNCKLKVKLWEVGSCERKVSAFFVTFILSEGIFLTFAFYLSICCIEWAFRIYINLYIKKHYFIHYCCLFSESLNAFSVSLMIFFASIHTLTNKRSTMLPLGYKTNIRINTFGINHNDISLIIKNYIWIKDMIVPISQ